MPALPRIQAPGKGLQTAALPVDQHGYFEPCDVETAACASAAGFENLGNPAWAWRRTDPVATGFQAFVLAEPHGRGGGANA